MPIKETFLDENSIGTWECVLTDEEIAVMAQDSSSLLVQSDKLIYALPLICFKEED